MAAAVLSRSLIGAVSGPSFLSGSKAHLLQSPAGPPCRPFVPTKPATFRCKMAETSAEPTDEDMANVGLDDVFNLIEQAERNDPSPDVPTDSRRRLTGWARWYKEFGKSLPKGVDARKALYGPDRPKWKGAFTIAADVPGHLKGQYAGDYGIDLLGFCKDEKAFARLRAQELFNARWAMLGVVGMLYPEFFPASEGFEPVWFKAGAQIFEPSGIDYLGAPNVINAHSIVAVAAAQALLMGGAEFARLKAPADMDPLYPGGKAFDPLGFTTDPESFAELKVKEIKNGRLAMLAAAGMFAQGALTGVGPVQNLKDWLHI